MEKCLELTIDYLEGRIQPIMYEKMLEQDDELYRWVQKLVPPKKTLVRTNRNTLITVENPFDIRDFLDEYGELDQGGPKGSISFHYHVHTEIAHLILNAFPEKHITVDATPARLRKLYFSACPDYIDGSEVIKSNILSHILEGIPQDVSFSKQVKLAKEKIKDTFHIEGRKWPRWIQSPEWPMLDGAPMKYVKTVRINEEFVQHYFEHPDTHYTRIVNDFF